MLLAMYHGYFCTSIFPFASHCICGIYHLSFATQLFVTSDALSSSVEENGFSVNLKDQY